MSFYAVGIEGLHISFQGLDSTIYIVSSFQGDGSHCVHRYPHFRGLNSTVCRGVLISGGWVPLYTEVSSFQGDGSHCVHRYPHFRGLSSTVYRGVLISGGWVPLYTEVSSFQGVGFHCI